MPKVKSLDPYQEIRDQTAKDIRKAMVDANVSTAVLARKLRISVRTVQRDLADPSGMTLDRFWRYKTILGMKGGQ